MDSGPLAGIRVLEVATGISGPYCGKLLADAGADVVKVEPAAGDPLRSWSASGAPTSGRGALFRFLNTSKRSVVGDLDTPAVDELAAAADLIIVDGGVEAGRIRELHAAHPGAVVVSLTPFGLTGPWPDADLPTTEFVLQAICGSTAWRGLRSTPPLQAGGRPGEWVTGVYGAAVGLAALRGARRDEREHSERRGDLVDISMFECMVVTMGGLTAVGAAVMGSRPAPRSLELPSIEPTSDGLVGFCTITAQQFQDFLILIERPDLLADENLATMPGRTARREEFLAAVHAWTLKHTTDEIIESASALRIPVAPIGAPDTVTSIDQFVARGAFIPHPDGTFQQPRVPYRIGEFSGRALEPAPEVGADTGA
ncbi:CaiB/BaiF CoA transferase family protein, partial [Frankia gtarii]|uniref:CaiB/BaiF CoA transferase family protein n=1 Tax=Frankia gtarii TaxID=2950102 RepID=UPI0021C0CFA1